MAKGRKVKEEVLEKLQEKLERVDATSNNVDEGSSTYVFEPGKNNLGHIKDFEAGDVIDLSAFSGLNFSEIAHQTGSFVLLKLGGGVTLRIWDAKLEDFSSDNLKGVEFEGDDDSGGDDSGGDGSAILPTIDGLTLDGTVSNTGATLRVTYVNVGDVAFTDWNGDGVGDIVTTNGAYGGGVVWINGADGQATRTISEDPGEHILADFNGDGVVDIVSTVRGGVGWFDGSFPYQFNRITSNDVGDFRVADVDGDGNLDVVANMGAFADGTALQGAVWYNASGAMNRISFNDLGTNYQVVDMNGDGAVEIISNAGTYESGASVGGVVSYATDGTMTRINSSTDEGFVVGNFDGDADLEILLTNGNYAGGAAIQGAMVVNTDGSVVRFSYNNMGDFSVGDVDGDGMDEVIAVNSSYQNGTAISGVMRYNADGTMERVGYQNVAEVHVVDIDGDGVDEILGTGGVAGDGVIEIEYNVGLDDDLIGSVNNDQLNGGEGNDTLTGAAGDDVFEFNNNFGNDVVTDFGTGNDVLLFSGVAGVATVTDVLNSAQVVGSDTVITIGSDSITLQGFTGLAASDVSVV